VSYWAMHPAAELPLTEHLEATIETGSTAEVHGLKTPDVLVLGGGGILGEAWMLSMLVGLSESESFVAADCDAYIGTSAGSIVATILCAGIDPRSRLGRLPEQPAVPVSDGAAVSSPSARALRLGASLAGVATGPLASIVLRSTAPGGRLLRRAALSRVPRGRLSLAELGREIDRSGVGWDGRLRISAVELESGRRVMFDGSGEPEISVSKAVQASCAIPGVFRPIAVDGRSYVDGGAWSPTNMDTADVSRGTRVLCLNPTGSLRPNRGTPFAALGAVSRSVAAIEAAALRQRGARVLVISPDRESVAAIGANLMDPAPRPQVEAAGLAQGRRLRQVSEGD
jgi:NTE family protein